MFETALCSKTSGYVYLILKELLLLSLNKIQ